MGGADDVRVAEQRVLGRRLLGEHVEGGAGDVARVEGGAQCLLVHEAAAGAVDDPHAPLGPGQGLGGQDVAGSLRHRDVEGDDVGAGEKLVQLDLLHAEVEGALRRQEGIVGDDPHAEPDRPVGDDRSRCCRNR
jgi:hypothetical protein